MHGSQCHFRRRSTQVAWWVVLATAALSGCPRAGHRPLLVYPVNGELFVDGKPAENAVIAFHPVNRTEWASATSRAVVDREGRFSLTTYAANDGAPEGEYVVTVYWPERPLDPAGEGDSLPTDKLGRKFASVSQSPLRALLRQQPVNLARVDLKDRGILAGDEFYFTEQAP